MNTTDRSIALVDAALRRRFYFFGFFPDEPPIQGLLGRWLKEYNPEATWVADLVDVANHELKDRHLGIGPSYFMKKDTPLDENRVRFIWEQGVIPYIEEQCFGDEAELNKFAYDTLKGKLNGTAPRIQCRRRGACRRGRMRTTGNLRTTLAMYELKLEEYASYPGNVRLNKDQLHALTADAHIEVKPSLDEDSAYWLKPSSYIGADKHR